MAATVTVAYHTLSEVARRCGVSGEMARTALVSLHTGEPGEWPFEQTGRSLLVSRDVAVRLAAHLDAHHRRYLHPHRRRPRAAAVERGLLGDSRDPGEN